MQQREAERLRMMRRLQRSDEAKLRQELEEEAARQKRELEMMRREDMRCQLAWQEEQALKAEAEKKRILEEWMKKRMVHGAGDMERVPVIARAILKVADKHDANGKLSVVEAQAHLFGSHYDEFAKWLVGNRLKNFKRFDTSR